jgi:hypothetical protein
MKSFPLPALRRIAPLAAAVALLAGIPAPASAAPLSVLGTAGGWRIKGNHEACVGDRTFSQNGTTLAFVVYSNGAATILIQNRIWDIPSGTYPVTVSIDRVSPATFQTSFYTEEQALVLNWEISANEISRVSNGSVFYANVGAANYQYSLSGSAEMLRAVLNCAEMLRRAANPYAGAQANPSPNAPANPFAETASNPYRRM